MYVCKYGRKGIHTFPTHSLEVWMGREVMVGGGTGDLEDEAKRLGVRVMVAGVERGERWRDSGVY